LNYDNKEYDTMNCPKFTALMGTWMVESRQNTPLLGVHALPPMVEQKFGMKGQQY